MVDGNRYKSWCIYYQFHASCKVSITVVSKSHNPRQHACLAYPFPMALLAPDITLCDILSIDEAWDYHCLCYSPLEFLKGHLLDGITIPMHFIVEHEPIKDTCTQQRGENWEGYQIFVPIRWVCGAQPVDSIHTVHGDNTCHTGARAWKMEAFNDFVPKHCQNFTVPCTDVSASGHGGKIGWGCRPDRLNRTWPLSCLFTIWIHNC